MRESKRASDSFWSEGSSSRRSSQLHLAALAARSFTNASTEEEASIMINVRAGVGRRYGGVNNEYRVRTEEGKDMWGY